jgi:hypothetical protein
VLLRQLSRRFGPVAPDLAARVRASSSDELDRLADRVLDAASIGDALG